MLRPGSVWKSGSGSLLAITTMAEAEQIGALLTGYEESPSVSTTGTGAFTAYGLWSDCSVPMPVMGMARTSLSTSEKEVCRLRARNEAIMP